MKIAVSIIVIVVMLVVPLAASAATAWGLAGGTLPHLISLVAEMPQEGVTRLQLSVSPLLVVNSATARVVLTPHVTSIWPYAWLGAGIQNVNEGDTGDATGTTGFVWGGVGARTNFGRVDVFLEVGGTGLMTDTMHEYQGVTAAVGFLILPGSAPE